MKYHSIQMDVNDVANNMSKIVNSSTHQELFNLVKTAGVISPESEAAIPGLKALMKINNQDVATSATKVVTCLESKISGVACSIEATPTYPNFYTLIKAPGGLNMPNRLLAVMNDMPANSLTEEEKKELLEIAKGHVASTQKPTTAGAIAELIKIADLLGEMGLTRSEGLADKLIQLALLEGKKVLRKLAEEEEEDIIAPEEAAISIRKQPDATDYNVFGFTFSDAEKEVFDLGQEIQQRLEYAKNDNDWDEFRTQIQEIIDFLKTDNGKSIVFEKGAHEIDIEKVLMRLNEIMDWLDFNKDDLERGFVQDSSQVSDVAEELVTRSHEFLLPEPEEEIAPVETKSTDLETPFEEEDEFEQLVKEFEGKREEKDKEWEALAKEFAGKAH